MKYDLGIIGFGPGGQKMALLARKMGLSVVIFEKSRPGGTCLNLGCIPTKSILHDSINKDFSSGIEGVVKQLTPDSDQHVRFFEDLLRFFTRAVEIPAV